MPVPGQQRTTKLIINAGVTPGTLVFGDTYSIHARPPAWRYQHETVCHGRGECARDENGDRFCDVRINTIEACGYYRTPGCVRTEASRNTSWRPTSAFAGSSITRGDAAKPCPAPSLQLWSHDPNLSAQNPTRTFRVSRSSLAASGPHCQAW
jgi:hypothetical protein